MCADVEPMAVSDESAEGGRMMTLYIYSATTIEFISKSQR